MLGAVESYQAVLSVLMSMSNKASAAANATVPKTLRGTSTKHRRERGMSEIIILYLSSCINTVLGVIFMQTFSEIC